jgi:hypothetical protein
MPPRAIDFRRRAGQDDERLTRLGEMQRERDSEEATPSGDDDWTGWSKPVHFYTIAERSRQPAEIRSFMVQPSRLQAGETPAPH